MKLNLNSLCSAVLTEKGAAIWNYAYVNVPFEYRPEPKKAGDTISAPLWEVMQVFGPQIHMSMTQGPFVGNILEITPC